MEASSLKERSTGQQFVIGDIHGCATELEALLNGLPLAVGDAVVFLGDYVDRGPASRAVVEILLELGRRRSITTTFLKGNHEDMLLAYMGYPGRYGDAYLHNGGIETVVSYGLPPLTPGPDLPAAFPDAHLEFFKTLAIRHLAPPFLMVHAGIDPQRALVDQRVEDMLWIRERFITQRHGLPYTVCFGHTPRREVLMDLPYKIGLDTGCVYGNRLSCIELREPRLFQVRAGSRQVETRSVEALFRNAGCASSA
jgi:serine/threonine protein phosphatase 1